MSRTKRSRRPRTGPGPRGGLFVFERPFGGPPRRRPATPRCAIVLLVALSTLAAIPGRAQVFRLEGGTSTQYNSTGASLNVRGAGYDGYIGCGDLESFRFGALVRTNYRGGVASFGDQPVPFDVPTDIFQSPHVFYGRGVGYDKEIGDVRLRAIAGATTTVYGSPFFQGAEGEKGAAVLFLDHDVSPTLRMMTRSVFSREQTVISGLDWRPRPDVAAAVAAGGGAGEPAASASVRFERPWIAARAAWSFANEAFRRVSVPQASESEMERENVDVKVRPVPNVVLQAGRYHFLQPKTDESPGYRGRVHQGLVNATWLGTTTTLGVFDSRAPQSGNRGTSIGLARRFGRSMEVSGNYYRAVDQSRRTFNTLVGVFRESPSPHLDLTQMVTHGDGNTTVSFGGNLSFSRFTAGAEWQTVYVPFAEGNPFRQALMLSVKIFAFGNLTANLGSYITPNGTVKYTLAGDQYFYRGLDAPPSQAKTSFSDEMVQGIVTDEKGQPVRGAAIRVDGDLVYSDTDGYFFVRKPKGRTCAIEVSVKDFLTPLPYTVVSAPATLVPQPEGRGTGAMIVVRPELPDVPKPQPRDWTGTK